MSELLSVVPGRVTAVTAGAALVEFPSPLPPRGAVLAYEGGLLEVLGAHNPTEVRAAVRAGQPPRPQAQTRLVDGPLLHPGCPHPLPLAQERAAAPWLTPGALLGTGHPGLDLYAPLRAGAGLALMSEDLESLRDLGFFVARQVAALTGWEALIVSARARPDWGARLPGARHLCAGPGAPLGEVSLLLRMAQAEVAAARAQGQPLLVVLDQPAALVSAWRQVDSPRASSEAASARWDRLLGQLTGGDDSVAVIGILWEDPTSPPLPGAGGELSGEELGSWARVEPGGRLDPGQTRTLWLDSPAVCARRRAASEASRAALSAGGGLGDHARIFGAEELEEAQAASLRRAEALEGLLLAAPTRAWGLEEGLEAAEALL